MATNELFNGLCNVHVKLGNGVKARALNWVHPFCQLKSDSQCLYNKYNQYNPLNIQNWNSKDNRPSVSIKFKLISNMCSFWHDVAQLIHSLWWAKNCVCAFACAYMRCVFLCVCDLKHGLIQSRREGGTDLWSFNRTCLWRASDVSQIIIRQFEPKTLKGVFEYGAWK